MILIVLAGSSLRGELSSQLRQLSPPNARLSEEFIQVVSVRELSDGRVIVADHPRDGRLVVADFRTNRVRQIGRQGAGPGEYPFALPVYALTGDSSLMANGLSRRWLLLWRDSIVATTTNGPAVDRTIMGTDQNGYVYAVAGPPSDAHGISLRPTDSSRVVRLRRNRAKWDTIAALSQGTFHRSPRDELLFPDFDVFAVAPDGWVAIVRMNPYRVDWVDVGGRLRSGAPLRDEVVKMNAKERAAYLGRIAERRQLEPADSAQNWPSTIPPTYSGPERPMATYDSLVVIRRTPTADHPVRYDVVDRKGRRVMTIALPKNHRIVGFGRASVYVVTVDDDDIHRLQRHSWPVK